jgi:hypothetical protein
MVRREGEPAPHLEECGACEGTGFNGSAQAYAQREAEKEPDEARIRKSEDKKNDS